MIVPGPCPSLSVVIVNWNAREMLRNCLESLVHEPDIQIVLVDNGSSDGSVAMALEKLPSLTLIEPGENIGYVRANNLGLQQCKGRYVLFLNNDTIVEPGAIETLVAFMDSRPDAGAASGLILNPDGSDQGCARRMPTLANGIFGRRSWLTRVWPGNPWSRRYLVGWHQNGDEPFEVEILSSAALLLRTEEALRLGGMDEDFHLYWVDAELCCRLRRAGRKIFCVPKARIVHFEGQGGSTKSFPMRVKASRAFHRDAYLAFVKTNQWSWWHPGALAAAFLLATRALLLLVLQFLRPSRATSSGMVTSGRKPAAGIVEL